MNKQGRISLAALCATAALFAVPAAASAGKYGTITVKAPCSKSSTGKITVTTKPNAGNTVLNIVVMKGTWPPTNPADTLFGKTFANPVVRQGSAAATGTTRTLSGKVPVGKKINAYSIVASEIPGGGGGAEHITFTVKKCAAFTG
jgi:hypothetical protein